MKRVKEQIRKAAGILLMAGIAPAWAGVIQTTTQLPPPSGAYTLGGMCVSSLNRCAANVVLSGFNPITDTEQNGNELVTVDASYSAGIYTDNGGVPGTFIGQILLFGTADFTFVGRDPSVNPLGTFVTELTGFDVKGTLNGNSLEVTENPGSLSIGSTTIVKENSDRVQYAVTGSLDIFGQYSFNGSSFMPAPGQMADLTTVPEPGSGVFAGSILTLALCFGSQRLRARYAGSGKRSQE